MDRKTVRLGEETQFVSKYRCGNCGGVLLAMFHPTDRDLYEIHCADGKEHTKIVRVETRDRILRQQAKDYREVKNFYDPDPERDDSAEQSLEDLGF